MPGDAWLLSMGFTIVSLGWQWDAAGNDALGFQAPIAQREWEDDQRFAAGRRDAIESDARNSVRPPDSRKYGRQRIPGERADDPRNVLTVRNSRNAPRTVIPRAQWQFAHTVDGKLVPTNASSI